MQSLCMVEPDNKGHLTWARDLSDLVDPIVAWSAGTQRLAGMSW